MASCDDDFPLLTDDNHHYQTAVNHPYAPHRYITKPTPIPTPPPPPLIPPAPSAAGSGTNGDETDEDDEGEEEEEEEDNSNQYQNEVNLIVRTVRTAEKRRDLEDNGEKNVYKRPKSAAAAEYRKDREEWTDVAIACLLDAYVDKFTQLNRGNLRGRDWEEVAAAVSERSERQTKTVEQCKNKVDNLKKRYKLEKHRMSNAGVSASHWPWFNKMEEIVGNSLPVKVSATAAVDEVAPAVVVAGSSGSAVRQSKRYMVTTASPASQISNVKSKSMPNFRWRRVVFKISGVSLAGSGPNNVDPKVMMLVAREVAMACRLGVEIAIVVGARNFFCGDAWANATGSDRRTAYQIGMMGSVMNSILLQSALEKNEVQARVQTAYAMQEVTEPYCRRRAIRHLEKGRVVIFGGIGASAGSPLYSSDSAAAVQASEIHAEAVLKGTNVDGVYDCHSRDSNVTFEHISFRDLVSRGVTSMDMMALTCCEENSIPVVVFNLLVPGNISKALCGEQVGTLIDQTGRIS